MALAAFGELHTVCLLRGSNCIVWVHRIATVFSGRSLVWHEELCVCVCGTSLVCSGCSGNQGDWLPCLASPGGCVGNGALLTRNKQVCSHMPVWSHRHILGEHALYLLLLSSRSSSSAHSLHFPPSSSLSPFMVSYNLFTIYIITIPSLSPIP